MKNILLLGTLVCISTAPTLSQSQLHSDYGNYTIDNWSIPDAESIVSQRYTSQIGAMNICRMGSGGSAALHRPGSDRVVAIASWDDSGPADLNPRRPWFDYGPIPPIEQLRMSECARMWGKPEKKADGVRTFKLVWQNHDFFIDTIFTHRKLHKYRVWSGHIRKDDWITINSPSKTTL